MNNNIYDLIKRDIPYLVEEIAEEVYQNGKLDMLKKSDVKYIVTYMRIETEIIVKKAMFSLVDIIYEENED